MKNVHIAILCTVVALAFFWLYQKMIDKAPAVQYKNPIGIEKIGTAPESGIGTQKISPATPANSDPGFRKP